MLASLGFIDVRVIVSRSSVIICILSKSHFNLPNDVNETMNTSCRSCVWSPSCQVKQAELPEACSSAWGSQANLTCNKRGRHRIFLDLKQKYRPHKGASGQPLTLTTYTHKYSCRQSVSFYPSSSFLILCWPLSLPDSSSKKRREHGDNNKRVE